MTNEVNYFQKLLKHKYPTLWDKVGVSVSAYSNYEQYLGGDSRMRAELNYNSYKQDITISFPNIGELYYDINFFIKFVWGTDDVIVTFDYSGTNHFKFTV
tara:strand:+ start:1377 stop:1676 length:300 start_codon:yes stop_codon:yes gene_type:complete